MAKIVIVEDNELVAKLYETKLKAESHQVVTVGDGDAALEAIRSLRPNLVLMDLILPGKSGVEVIRELKQDYRFTNLPIIAYSGGDTELLDEARRASPTKLISKREATLKEIMEDIREVLEMTRTWQIYDPHAFENSEEAREPTDDFTSKRILIVEDDKIVATIVKNIVEKEGFEAIMVHDGREALSILNKDADFAAAVFDIEIPGFTGIDLLDFMRREKRLSRIPVMVMTASSNYKFLTDTYAAGASLFIPKPFERSKFETMFRLLVEIKK